MTLLVDETVDERVEERREMKQYLSNQPSGNSRQTLSWHLAAEGLVGVVDGT